MMRIACTLGFCGCTSLSCDQEDNQQVNMKQEHAQLEHECLQRLSMPNLYAHMFTKSAYEMHENLYTPLSPVIFVNLKDEDHYFLERVRYTVDLHDTFALIRTCLDSWDLPCIVMCRYTHDTITGLELLAIGLSATINWIGLMVNDSHVMAEYVCFAGLLFTKDCRTAVITPYDLEQTQAPGNSLVPSCHPHTQLWISPSPSAPSRVYHHNSPPVADLDKESNSGMENFFITRPQVHTTPMLISDEE